MKTRAELQRISDAVRAVAERHRTEAESMYHGNPAKLAKALADVVPLEQAADALAALLPEERGDPEDGRRIDKLLAVVLDRDFVFLTQHSYQSAAIAVACPLDDYQELVGITDRDGLCAVLDAEREADHADQG